MTAKNNAMRRIIELALVFVLFLAILSLPILDLHKFVLEVLLLGLYSFYLHKKYDIEYYYGMLMLKTKEGLHRIDEIAGYGQFWNDFADIGIVLAYGLATPLIHKHVSRRNLAIGCTVLFLSALYILPNLYPIALSVIAFPYEGVSSHSYASQGDMNFAVPLIILAVVLVGYATIATASLIYQALSILYSLYLNLFNGGANAIQPGASLLLPGINLPFVEGIIALLFILFFHELSHAILSRIAKVRLKSAGILLFGFIPVGAFVDPDEDVLSKKSAKEQARVLVAGSSANFALSIISLILFAGLVAIPLNVYDNGLYIIAAKQGLPLQKGDIIYSINGVNMTSLDAFFEYRDNIKPNSTVILGTSRGEFNLTTNENSKIGVMLQRNIKESFGWYIFLKNLFALLFSLNFFVATVNLLPIPLFDGHRLLELGLGKKRELLLKAIAVITGASLLMNLLPWLF